MKILCFNLDSTYFNNHQDLDVDKTSLELLNEIPLEDIPAFLKADPDNHEIISVEEMVERFNYEVMCSSQYLYRTISE